MTDYKTGIIYKIVHCQSDICYVGMTMDRLAKRWQKHKDSSKNAQCKSGISIYPYMRQYGVENFKIMTIKEYQVLDKQHLKIYETLWMTALRCVNKVPSFNPIPRKEYKKIYGENNKERLDEYKKLYRENNKDKIAEAGKEYYEKNKEIICMKSKIYKDINKERLAERGKTYRENNKDTIKAKKSEKFVCECGSHYTNGHKARHFRTAKHQNFVNNQ